MISVEEYLHTMYRPDCDYIDREVRERNWGEHNHGRLQGAVATWLASQEHQIRIRTLISVRVQMPERSLPRSGYCLDPTRSLRRANHPNRTLAVR